MSEAVYADGGTLRINPSPDGGTWAWCRIDDNACTVATGSGYVWPTTRETRLSLDSQVDTAHVTNNQTEFYALLSALEALPDGWSGRVCSDSAITLGRFFNEYKISSIPDDWLRRGSIARLRLGQLTPVQLDGHPTRLQLRTGIGKRGNPVSEHQAWCDHECNRLARRFTLSTARALSA